MDQTGRLLHYTTLNTHASVKKDTANGERLMLESIDKVIERCRYRIDRSLDVNISDVIRLIEEVEKNEANRKNLNSPAYALWHGLGSGD